MRLIAGVVAVIFLIGCTPSPMLEKPMSPSERAIAFYQSRLASLPGVDGAAIDSSSGRPVLRIFLGQQSVEALSAIPDSVGSVRVEIFNTTPGSLPMEGE